MKSKYAEYYDLLYSHRDFEGEVQFLIEAFKFADFRVNNVLDVGCGSGAHTIALTRKGFKVVGIDLSREMISNAVKKACEAGVKPRFLVGDIRKLTLKRKFDAAVAIYGVLSYFTGDKDLKAALDAIRSYLRRGGIFIFDTWNLLGVYAFKHVYQEPTAEILRWKNFLAVKSMKWRINFENEEAEVKIDCLVLDLMSNKLVDFFKVKLTLKIFTLREIMVNLEESKFKVLRVLSDFSFSSKFTIDSPDIVVVAKRI